MDDLLFYIRLDDPDREAAGLKLASDLETHFVPVDAKDIEKTVCFKSVMVEYSYHIYTGGYSYVVDPWEIQQSLWHSNQYWYPVGWSGGYQGFAHVLNDAYMNDIKGSDDYGKILAGVHNGSFIQNKYVCSIPIWSSASAQAYRTGWSGVVNHEGYGTTWGTGGVFYWSLFNMEKGGVNTINLGFKASPEDLSPVSSEWVWDWIALDAMYETLLVRNPYDLSKDRGMLATSWSTGTWDGGTKIYVDFNLKNGVKWHDGTLLTAEDVKWGLEFIRNCGPGVAWNQMAVSDVDHIDVTASGPGGSVRVYFNTASYWAVHLAGFTEFPSRKIWMNASAHYGWGYDPTKPEGIGAGYCWPTDAQRMMVRNYHIYTDDIYDPTSATPNADGTVDLVQDGTGPWKFVGYTGPINDVEYIDMEAFRQHHLSQDEVSTYLNEAFHAVGNVNYPGSAHESDYNAALIGVDRVIDEPDLTLLQKAYLKTSLDTPGIGWGQWNVDADVNDDNICDDLDSAIANFFYGKSAG
jgi:hypothetical protein